MCQLIIGQATNDEPERTAERTDPARRAGQPGPYEWNGINLEWIIYHLVLTRILRRGAVSAPGFPHTAPASGRPPRTKQRCAPSTEISIQSSRFHYQSPEEVIYDLAFGLFKANTK